MNTITAATKAKIEAAHAADPSRWETNGGNENGPREIKIDGHEICMGTDPDSGATYWYAWDKDGRQSGEGVIGH